MLCYKYYKSCLTLCHPMDYSSPGSSVHGILLFSWQEYWSGLLCSPPGSLLDPGIEPMSLMRPALASGFFTISILLGKYAQFPVVYVNNMYFMHSYQFCMTDCSLIWRLVRTKRNSTREFGDETQRGKHEVTSWRKKKELHAI